MILAIIGGACGLLIAIWGVDWLVSLEPEGIPRLSDVHIDTTVIWFTMALSFATGLLFGMVPAFHAVALLLAAVGVFGVVSYAVVQRTREIGIRMALGAQSRSVLGLIVRQAMLLAGIGVAIGIMLAWWLSQSLVSKMLFSTSPHDVSTYVVVAALLGAVALLASYIPAHRVTRVDPIVALRAE